MRALIFIQFLLAIPISASGVEQACVCKCVVKDSSGEISTMQGQGKDREAAGEDLKKNLAKQKCELSPTCSGKCSLDS